jgi:hypothetical protein
MTADEDFYSPRELLARAILAALTERQRDTLLLCLLDHQLHDAAAEGEAGASAAGGLFATLGIVAGAPYLLCHGPLYGAVVPTADPAL